MRVHFEEENGDFILNLLSIGNGSAPNNDSCISMVDNNVATAMT